MHTLFAIRLERTLFVSFREYERTLSYSADLHVTQGQSDRSKAIAEMVKMPSECLPDRLALC